jgi:chromosome segregation ATPase
MSNRHEVLRRRAKAARGFEVSEDGACRRSAEWKAQREADVRAKRDDLLGRVTTLNQILDEDVDTGGLLQRWKQESKARHHEQAEKAHHELENSNRELASAIAEKEERLASLRDRCLTLDRDLAVKRHTLESLEACAAEAPPEAAIGEPIPVEVPPDWMRPEFKPEPELPPTVEDDPILPWRERFRLIWNILRYGRIRGRG